LSAISHQPSAASRQLPAVSHQGLMSPKRVVEPQRRKGRKGVRCLVSMRLFTQRVNVIRIANPCFYLRPCAFAVLNAGFGMIADS
ncbi:hypothetical protein, partial [Thiocapsa sp.]|uniref:hypothetical protein n=1 Tax=Thiocapsa sp. TaxID=2024551 RepID=UPI0025E28817